MQVTAGTILGRSFNVVLKNLGVFLAISVLLNIPPLLVQLFVTQDMSPRAASTINSIVGMLFGGLVTGALLHGVVQSLGGGKAQLGPSMRAAMGRFGPIFLVSLLYGLGVGLGLMLLIVPGVLLACIWYVAVPVTLIEKRGVMASFSRSGDLTKGYRMALFVTLLVFFGVALVISMVVLVPLALKGGSPLVMALIGFGLAVTLGLWGQAAQGVAYHDLRMAKEGMNTQDLEAVFA